jgi:hypothetical protein
VSGSTVCLEPNLSFIDENIVKDCCSLKKAIAGYQSLALVGEAVKYALTNRGMLSNGCDCVC